MKKLCMLLSVVLLLSLFAPVAKADLVKYDTPVDITAVRAIPDGIQFEEGDSIENNMYTRAYLDELGINLTYTWTVPATEFDQKLNVAIAADDLPDIIPTPNLRIYKQLVDTGVAADMTAIFDDTAAPFTKEMFAADNNVARDQITVDGKMYGLPYIGGNVDGASMLWLRNDWLTKLGLSAPKTMEELTAVLTAFKDNDPDGNGEADTYGLALEKSLINGFGAITGLFEGYGAYPNGWITLADGTIAYGGIQPEAREALEALQTLFKAGLIDPEFSVKDTNKVAEMTTAGTAGALYGQHWVPFWPLQSCKDANPDSDWTPFAIPTKTGDPAKVMLGGSAGTVYVVNTNCVNPEAAMKMYDFFFAKDCALAGDSFDPEFHADDARKYNRYQYALLASTYPKQNLFIHQGVMKFFNEDDQSMLENYWVGDNITQNQKFDAGDNAYWMTHAWSGPTGAFSVIDNYINNDQMLVNAYIKADTQTMTDSGATLRKMQDEIYTKIIMNTAPIEEFDTFVENWLANGGQDITAEVNAEK